MTTYTASLVYFTEETGFKGTGWSTMVVKHNTRVQHLGSWSRLYTKDRTEFSTSLKNCEQNSFTSRFSVTEYKNRHLCMWHLLRVSKSCPFIFSQNGKFVDRLHRSALCHENFQTRMKAVVVKYMYINMVLSLWHASISVSAVDLWLAA